MMNFVLLKILAFLDRKEQNSPKYKTDAAGIYYWLKNYADSGTLAGGRRGRGRPGMTH